MNKTQMLNRQFQKVSNLYEAVIATRKMMDVMIIAFNAENEGRPLNGSDNLGMIIKVVDTHYDNVFQYTLAINALKYHLEMLDTTKL